ncbi:MAG: hypothetical protein PHW76_09845 [Alphaproteobacteria bacterium]|nr:hypothetical protein [Alphaproteobacteria bacterium]
MTLLTLKAHLYNSPGAALFSVYTFAVFSYVFGNIIIGGCLMSYFKFVPGENDPLKKLRRYCEEASKRLGDSAVTKSMTQITAVGAEYGWGNKTLGNNDKRYFEIALDHCELLGIPVSPRFELTPLNLAYGEEQDFLNPKLTLPTDLLIVCSILVPMKDASYSKRSRCGESDFSGPGAWYQAAERTNSSVIVTVGLGFGEVGVAEFEPPKGVESIYKEPETGDFYHPLRHNYRDIGILVKKSICEKSAPPSREVLAGIQRGWEERPWAQFLKIG